MAKVKTQSQNKKKKKVWVQINAPKLFGNKKIGETYVTSAQDAVGKRVEQNLMTLSGEMKKQNINIKFIIDRVNGNVAHTRIISYRMVPSFIKRIVRRRRDKIDFSKVFKTKDGKKVRIKPLIITASKSRGSTLTSIQKKAVALINVHVSKLSFDSLVEEIISYKFQNYLKNNLKNIHPLKSCEIRQFQIEENKKTEDGVEIEESFEENEEKEESNESTTEQKDSKKEKETKKEEVTEGKTEKKESKE